MASLSNIPLFLSFSCNPNFKFKTFSHVNQPHSHNPVTNSSSLSKPKIWVNPNNPKSKPLQNKNNNKSKPSNSRNRFLLKLVDSLDSCDPTNQQVNAILNAFISDGVSERDAVFILDKMTNPKTAHIVMGCIRDRIEYVRDNGVVLYNVTLKVFRKCNDFDGAQKVFDEMLQRGVKPDNITFTTMINCARMSALPDKAVEWFEKMPGFGCEPDAITCSAMVCAYARTNHVDMALKQEAKMKYITKSKCLP